MIFLGKRVGIGHSTVIAAGRRKYETPNLEGSSGKDESQ
jgi:hypothetical protein